MIALGLNETLSYILINDKEVKGYTLDEFEPLKLLDPITEDRNTLRYSMIPSLYKIYEYNSARSQKDISIFEIGKGFYKKGEVYGEDTKLCALMTGKYSIGLGNSKVVDFYTIKGIAEEMLDYIGYEGRYKFEKREMPKEMHPGQSAYITVDGKNIGIIGKIHPNVTMENVFVLEINLDELFKNRVGKMKYKEISKLKETDFIEYVKQKEILFIKTDLKKIRNDKTDYSRLIKYYKRKLVDYGVMKEIRKAKKQNVKYFGIKKKTSEKVREQVKVLYYNSKEDFAIKLLTKSNDEVIISRGNKANTFGKIYAEIKENNENFKGSKNIEEDEIVKIPNIDFKLKKEFNEIEAKPFLFASGEEYVIEKAVQTIEFSLDEKGGRVKSEAGMTNKTTALSTF